MLFTPAFITEETDGFTLSCDASGYISLEGAFTSNLVIDGVVSWKGTSPVTLWLERTCAECGADTDGVGASIKHPKTVTRICSGCAVRNIDKGVTGWLSLDKLSEQLRLEVSVLPADVSTRVSVERRTRYLTCAAEAAVIGAELPTQVTNDLWRTQVAAILQRNPIAAGTIAQAVSDLSDDDCLNLFSALHSLGSQLPATTLYWLRHMPQGSVGAAAAARLGVATTN